MSNMMFTTIKLIIMQPYNNRSFFPFNRVKQSTKYDATANVQIKYDNCYTLHQQRHLKHHLQLLQTDQLPSMGQVLHQALLRMLQ